VPTLWWTCARSHWLIDRRSEALHQIAAQRLHCVRTRGPCDNGAKWAQYVGYRLVEKISSGRTTEVFLATAQGEHHFEKSVVIKRLLPHLAHDEDHRKLLAEEAKLGGRLAHPKIAHVVELGRLGELLYIAMEHVDGMDVATITRKVTIAQLKLEPLLAAWIVHEMLDALDYAHGLGIVHRDVAPSNVVISKRGDVKLIDFGVPGASATSAPSSTAVYMSPEQVTLAPIDPRSDVFSAGVVLAELLTGRRLFAAANDLDVLLMVRDANLERFEVYGADVDPNLAAIVRKALRKTIGDRWQTAAAFRDALGEWLFNQQRISSKHVATFLEELRTGATPQLTRPSLVVARTLTPPVPSVSIPPARRAASPVSVPAPRAASAAAEPAVVPSSSAPIARPLPASEYSERRAPPRAAMAPLTRPAPAQAAAPAPQPAVRPAGHVDDRPRQSTRGMLHVARIKPGAAMPAPYSPPAGRGRIGSSENRVPAVEDTQVADTSDGVVSEPAGDTISLAVSSVLVDERSRR